MSQGRIAGVLLIASAGALLGAMAGCYSDVPAQSTLPEPVYVSGPPSGPMDPVRPAPAVRAEPAPAAAASADDDEDDAEAPAAVPPAGPDVADGQADSGGVIAGPPSTPIDDVGEVGTISGGPAEAAPAQPPALPADQVAEAQVDPTGNVNDAEIEATLAGYGQWVDTDDGQVWCPDATQVGVDFTPYESGGSWAYSDVGWSFVSDYPWGWLPYHYGRWGWFHGYWGWRPGHRWGAAWVDWRHGNGLVGWRPLPPKAGAVAGHRFGAAGFVARDAVHAEQHNANWRFSTVSDFARPHIRAHTYGNLGEGLRLTSAVAAPPFRGTQPLHASQVMTSRFAPRPTGAAAPRAAVRVDPATSYGASRTTVYGPSRSYQPPARSYSAGPARGYIAPTRSYQPPRYSQPARGYQPPRYPSYGRYYGGQPSRPAAPSRSFAPSRPSAPPMHSSPPPTHSSAPSSSSSHSSSSSSGGSHHR